MRLNTLIHMTLWLRAACMTGNALLFCCFDGRLGTNVAANCLLYIHWPPSNLVGFSVSCGSADGECIGRRFGKAWGGVLEMSTYCIAHCFLLLTSYFLFLCFILCPSLVILPQIISPTLLLLNSVHILANFLFSVTFPNTAWSILVIEYKT